MEEKKSSAEWSQLIYGEDRPAFIMDPDGWDRKNFQQSWDESITLDEYSRRVVFSTPVRHIMEREATQSSEENKSKDKASIPSPLKEAFEKDDYEEVWKIVALVVAGMARDFLTDITQKNPESMNELCEYRVPLQMDDSDDSKLKVTKVDGKEGLHFGILGIINGIMASCFGDDYVVAGAYDSETGKLIKFLRKFDYEEKEKTDLTIKICEERENDVKADKDSADPSGNS